MKRDFEAWGREWLGGYRGEFILCWRSAPYIVRTKDGRPASFKTQLEAEVAAWRTKWSIETPFYRGWISKQQGSKAAAEGLFMKVKRDDDE